MVRLDWLLQKIYSQRTVNLTDVVAGGKPDKVEWTDAVKNEFQDLKNILIQRPVLAAPDFNIPFIVAAGASGRGIGGVLSQVFGNEGEKPTVY